MDLFILKTNFSTHQQILMINTFLLWQLYQKDKSFFSQVANPQLLDKLLKNKLEDETKFSSMRIVKKKSENGVPLYYHKNILLTKSCSISHHGNYGVFSLILN